MIRSSGSRDDLLASSHVLEPITIDQIEQASARIRGSVLRTPIVRLNIDSDMAIYLKLENLQPTSSFKVWGACNAIASAGPAAKSRRHARRGCSSDSVGRRGSYCRDRYRDS